jgi:cysteine-rich repeat protein
MKARYKALLLILALIVTFSLLLSQRPCTMTGISEIHFNLMDDDCDWMVDEGFASRVCGNSILEEGEFCDDGNTINLDGCSSDCKLETNRTIYVPPYMGNIDGDFSEKWYYVYHMITEFHDSNGIASGFSIYPASIQVGGFGDAFRKMYNSPHIEFIQKSFTGGEIDRNLDKLSFEDQKAIIRAGREFFRKAAEKIIGTGDIEVPVAYNQPQGKFTESMRSALRQLGFVIFFDMYRNEEYEKVDPFPDFDVVQYGAGFTIEGDVGKDSLFRSPDDIINEIKNYSREDINILTVNGNRVVPIWVHHSDFESRDTPTAFNWTKWEIYTETMLMLKEDPDIVIVTPSQVFEMRHP